MRSFTQETTHAMTEDKGELQPGTWNSIVNISTVQGRDAFSFACLAKRLDLELQFIKPMAAAAAAATVQLSYVCLYVYVVHGRGAPQTRRSLYVLNMNEFLYGCVYIVRPRMSSRPMKLRPCKGGLQLLMLRLLRCSCLTTHCCCSTIARTRKSHRNPRRPWGSPRARSPCGLGCRGVWSPKPETLNPI